jgi:UDP-N-acetyl-D-mannosaminuronic acid dehydrogenase
LEEFSLFVIRSTVSIGTTMIIIYEPLLEQGYNILVSMCPERTVEGNALVEIRELPQIIGGVNEMSSHVSKLFFNKVSRETIVVENSESAELIKLINNTYRDLMFGFANEIAEISLSFGLNSREIIASANENYARSNIALPGPSGGPCLEKDPWILYESAASNGVEANITKSARELNENVVVGFLKASLGEAKDIHKVALLGLAFKGKPKTRDTRGSYVREVCSFLRRSGIGLITGFEPAGTVIDLDDVLDESFDLITAIKDANLIILLTNAVDFLGIENLISDSAAKNATIVDFWGAINQESLRTDLRLKSWG